MKAILFLVFTFLLGYVQSQCAESQTWNGTLTPTTDTLYIESLAPAYDSFTVIWEESPTNQILVSVSVCSNSATDYNNLGIYLDNEANGSFLKFQDVTATTATTTGTTTGTTGTGTTGTTGASAGTTTANQTTATSSSTSGAIIPTSTSSSSSSSGSAASTSSNSAGSSSTTGISSGISSAPNHFLSLLFVSFSLFFLGKNRLSLVFVLIAVVLLGVNSQTTSSTTLTVTIGIPASLNEFCVSGSCFFRNSSGSITQYISLFGQRYAALDQGANCSTTAVQTVPSGWVLAPPTAEALAAIALGSWNTYLMITSDGNGYEAGLYNTIQSTNLLVPAGTGAYKVKTCLSRILITQSFPIPETGHTIVRAPIITNIITFNGNDYATADNTAFSNTVVGCQPYAVYLNNTSWVVAADEPASLVVIQGDTTTWGTLCVVLADSTSYEYNLTPCSGAGLLATIPYLGGSIYSVSNCNRRILLSRPSTAAPSWAPSIPITESYGWNGTTWATLDNADPKSASDTGCQANFLSLPAGYQLVTPAQLTLWVANNSYKAWISVYCFATLGLSLTPTGLNCTDGNGVPTGQLITETVGTTNFYQTSTCARVLLVQS